LNTFCCPSEFNGVKRTAAYARLRRAREERGKREKCGLTGIELL